MLSTLAIDGGAIEDLLSKADYKKYVLENATIQHDVSNSEHAKTGTDKVLPAKSFLEKQNNYGLSLDAESLKNISATFKDLTSKFESYN